MECLTVVLPLVHGAPGKPLASRTVRRRGSCDQTARFLAAPAGSVKPAREMEYIRELLGGAACALATRRTRGALSVTPPLADERERDAPEFCHCFSALLGEDRQLRDRAELPVATCTAAPPDPCRVLRVRRTLGQMIRTGPNQLAQYLLLCRWRRPPPPLRTGAPTDGPPVAGARRSGFGSPPR